MNGGPIAIVGRGCVLPGALDPDAFWDNVACGRTSLAPLSDSEWSLPPDQLLDRAWSDVAGIVSGFGPCTLDPVFDWTIYAVRSALREAGRDGPQPRAGLIVGNLACPTLGFARYADHVWHPGGPAVDPRNRFCSGYPALYAARELGLGAGAFTLDAACASTLYAIKLGCDRLHEGSADLMLVAGVNAVDIRYTLWGFAVLGALSSKGLSRPFHRDTDGLVPGEGAVCFALMRLSDAVAERIDIRGVIRGIGLSNDGRSGGFLTPARATQVAAMRSAYARSGLDPQSVSLVECHAAGTAVGDATEIASMAEVFADSTDLPVGSVKSNVGHLLTAAGGAGLLKVLGALAAGVRPATLGAAEPRDEFAGTALRPLQHNEDWPGRRRAAVSAFGFGGCNAHLIVESFEPDRRAIASPSPPPRHEVAVVAVNARVGGSDLEAALLAGESDRNACSFIEVALDGLRFPPADLPDLLAQQSSILQVARDAVDGIALPRDHTMVMVGMGCDPEGARYLLRWQGHRVEPQMNATRAMGRLSNIVANRINAQLDLTGPSFTVSAEEASGLVALRLAADAIRCGEAEAAVVGAVDLSHELVHETALRGLGIDRPPGDAAVALVLKRLAHARRDGDPILALVGDRAVGESDLTVGDCPGSDLNPTEWFGSAHAACGLLAAAVAVLALQHRVLPRQGAPADNYPTRHLAEVVTSVLDSPPFRISMTAGDPVPLAFRRSRTGRYTKLRAHPMPVAQALDDARVDQPRPEPINFETMPRAQSLAPVLGNGAAAVENRGGPPDPVTSGPSHPIAAGLERVAELHRGFLVRQAEVHQQYLHFHAQLQAALLGEPTVAPRPYPRPPDLGQVPAPPDLGQVPAPPRHDASEPSRVRFDRGQLLIHARGVISELFGPKFAAQDGFPRQTRLPEPPLLLVDRVLALDAVPASMGLGTIRTQTDVRLDDWYLDSCGRMPAGLCMEAGQADLMLISWLGVDLVNRGERVYRVLGGELIFHGSLPRAGDTLDYTIGLDGHHEHNGVRLFSFHSDCMVAGERRLTVRSAQAGFFTDAELASTGGVLWDPAAEPARDDGPVDPPPAQGTNDRFDAAAVTAFYDGRPADCFGDPWQPTRAHVRTPQTASGRLKLLDEVTRFDPDGGPWGRGYLCARTAVAPDDWFFAGHFHNDPCMPGTLMVEAAIQAMCFYLAAVGSTIDRDRWRFEPVPDVRYLLRCRGQVNPASKLITYEVFVSGFTAGPIPTLFADVLGTVDGVKACHVRRVGMRLVPDEVDPRVAGVA